MEKGLSYILYGMPVITAFYLMYRKLDSRRGMLVIAGIMIALLAFRDGVGVDYFQYRGFYYAEYYSPELLSKLILWGASFFDSHYWYFSIYAVLTVGFVYLAAKENGSVGVLVGYLCLPWFYIESFSILRQAAAIGVCFYCYSLFLNESRRFYLFSFVALMLHFSCLPFLAFLWVSRVGGKWLWRGLILSALILVVFVEQFLAVASSLYPRLEYYDGVHGYGWGLFLVSIFFCVVGFSRKELSIHYYVLLFGLIVNFVALGIDSVFIRLAYYFYIPLCFLSWRSLWAIDRTGFLVLLMYLSIYFVFISVRTGDFDGSLIPYSTYLW